VVALRRTWQGADIPTGGTKIGVTVAMESDARMRHTKLTLPGFRQGIARRAFEVFLGAA
jgi:hypothetical protein